MNMSSACFWRSQERLRQNREADRSSFIPFSGDYSAVSRRREDSDRVLDLNGKWAFAWFDSPLKVPPEFLDGSRLPEDFIQVPLNWQFSGYGKMHYTDEAYPFPINPPSIPWKNETGVYSRDFELGKEQLYDPDGRKNRIFVNFDGVESAFVVYLNGHEVGFNQGSRMMSEFELSPYVKEGKNRLTVWVMQYSAAVYLEDQDQWWLGGIIRDVTLLIRPAVYIKNCRFETDWCPASAEGKLELTAETGGGEAEILVQLMEGERCICSDVWRGGELQAVIPDVKPWSAETPHLYTLVLSLLDEGKAREKLFFALGFRRLEITDGELRWNGRRIFFKGVNRHEFNAEKGRVADYAQTEKELLAIKAAGWNAVRTSHYPDSPYFYDLCDRIGLYVIDEADLETHGFEIEGKPSQLAEDPAWREAYLDRIRRMVTRDRNHVCVALWSLGNESSYGENFRAMYEWCKKNEPVRPVHYEGDVHNLTADVSSTMYTTIGGLAELDLQNEPKRPHILCEFGHAMGNGAGSLSDYLALIHKSERIQGCFIWEFKDHGIKRRVRPEAGAAFDAPVEEEQFLYGGDFGELYHNKNFCLDGITDSRFAAKPPFLEYRKVLESLHVKAFCRETGVLEIENRFDFLSSEGFRAVVELRKGQNCCLKEILPLPLIEAGESGAWLLPENIREAAAEADYLYLTFCKKEAAEKVSEKHLMLEANEDISLLLPVAGSFGCRLREPRLAPLRAEKAPEVSLEQDAYRVKSGGLDFRVSFTDGRIYDLKSEGESVLRAGPALNLYRAPTDNDVKIQDQWDYFNLHSMVMDVTEHDCLLKDNIVYLTYKGRMGAEGKFFGVDLELTYRIAGDEIELHAEGRFSGKGPEHLPKIGLLSEAEAFFVKAYYDGLGPHENYNDRKASARPGLWRLPTDEREVYDFPQEYGSRHDCRSLRLEGEKESWIFASDKPFDLAVRPYADLELRRKQHRFELEKADCFYVHTDLINSGLGSASCGPERLPAYRALPLPFTFTLRLKREAKRQGEAKQQGKAKP